jgi:hypothetical protein
MNLSAHPTLFSKNKFTLGVRGSLSRHQDSDSGIDRHAQEAFLDLAYTFLR